MTRSRLLLAVLALSLLATPVLGHVPGFPTGNDSPERAVVVPDAAKSWSFYDRLEDSGVKYYRFSLAPGDRLRVGAFTPTEGPFTPSVVLMSPSFSGTAGVPDRVTVPDGMGAVVFEGTRPTTAGYEPFAPSADYHTVSVDRPVTTASRYVLAVYEPEGRGGNVGVTVGYEESFSLVEYLTVPFDLVGVHHWAGQPTWLVLGPWVGTVVVGGLLVGRRVRSWSRPVVRGALVGGGSFFVASAVGKAVQTALTLSVTGPRSGALVTAAFVLVPLVCGGWTLALSLRDPLELTPRARLGLLLAGGFGLATWAGFVVGPAALLVVALLGARTADRRSVLFGPTESPVGAE